MREDHSPGVRLAAKISQHASIYALAAGSGIVSGLLSVIVYTRYINPTEFGRLAVLSTIASVITLVANTPTLQGTMSRVYGASGDEESGEDENLANVSDDTRLSLTTGLALTTFVGTALLLATWACQRPLANLLIGESRDSDLVVLTAIVGALGAMMRLPRNIVRLQRRPLSYLMITVIGSLGSTLIAIPLLAQGLALEAILIGMAAANAVALVLNLALLRSDVRAAISAREAVEIMRAGVYYVPIIVSFQMIQLADTLLVANFASFQATGLYRVAQKTATPVTYGTSVFVQAWGPMQKDLVNVAAGLHHGADRLAARMVTHYAVFVTAIVLTVGVFADQIVQLASSEYSSAAALVPLMALSISGHGWYVVSYRVSNAAHKRQIFLMMSVVAALVFIIACAVLIPALGASGAPLAGIAAWSSAAVTMVVFGQASEDPVPFEYRRLIRIALVTAVAWVVGYLVLPSSLPGLLGKFGVIGAWFVALVALDVVPFDELRRFARFLGASRGAESKRRLRARVAELDPQARDLLEQVALKRAPVDEVAERAGLSTDEVLVSTVRSLRAISGGGPATELDAAIGSQIFKPKARVQQDLALRTLIQRGLDPIDADQLVRAAQAMRGRRRRRH